MGEDWIKEWQEGTVEFDEATVEWMQSRPDDVKAVMRNFPPSCLVRAKEGVELVCPAPGTTGVIRSYYHGADGVQISVAEHPESDMWAHCDPEWLEVVGFYRDLDMETTASILDSRGLH